MSATINVPSHTKVLVIGGGPGGSYAAAVLAREGIDVVLLEASKFPRFNGGESTLGSLCHFLRFIDAERKVEEHGFRTKPGAAILFNQWKREGYNKFGESERSEFDEILLRHAEESGAKVVPITDRSRPLSKLARMKRSITFDYLVDASGRAGIMATKYLKNRYFNETLKNIACWAYWTSAGMYAVGTDRENAPCGWAWLIPLQGKLVSVGIVMDSKVSTSKKAAGSAATEDGRECTLQDHYLSQLAFAPRLKKLLGGAELRIDATGKSPTVRSASDYSYTASGYFGDHFRLVGGLTAAVTIAASIRQYCSEEEAGRFHDHKVAVSYTRFLLTVMGSYKQIRNQQVPVLSDINEANFDRAFDLIRPIIQGTADIGQMLTEDEVQKAMDFVTHVFVPSDPEMQQRVGTRLGMDILAPGPILTMDQISGLAAGDEDTEWVLKQANANKTVSDFYTRPDRLLGEVVNGFIGCTTKGRLGLVRVSQKPEVRRE
ncbi:hypothetical protein B0H13DRAFT_2230484 [Mycena leptocephala]|nr:hypothetical protein B0H13DRAFT_2230484 [Mycena leptocephala]